MNMPSNGRTTDSLYYKLCEAFWVLSALQPGDDREHLLESIDAALLSDEDDFMAATLADVSKDWP